MAMENKRGLMVRPAAWFEITGKDAAGLRGFYERLFGWQTAKVAPNAEYGVMDAAPNGIGGGIGPGRGGDGHVTIFVEVADIEMTLRKAEELGAKRMGAPIEVPDMRPSSAGKGSVAFAYFADPEGHVVGLCKGIVKP